MKGDILVVLISRPYHFLLKIKLKIKKGNLRSRYNFSDLGGFLRCQWAFYFRDRTFQYQDTIFKHDDFLKDQEDQDFRSYFHFRQGQVTFKYKYRRAFFIKIEAFIFIFVADFLSFS